MSPEIRKGEGDDEGSKQADVWALGITLIVLLKGNLSEFVETEKEVEKLIGSLTHVSELCVNFLRQCLQISPEKRIRAEEMMGHPWLGLSSAMTASTVGINLMVTQIEEMNAITLL